MGSVSTHVIYSLHISSFRKLSSIEKEIKRLAEEGVCAWWKEVHIPDKGEWFRLYVGEKENRIEAEELGKMLKSSGTVDSFTVHRIEKRSENAQRAAGSIN